MVKLFRHHLKAICLGLAVQASAQVPTPAPAPSTDAAKQAPPAPEEITDRYKQNPEFVDIIQDPVPAKEKASICKTYSRRYISYYGNVYWVENCMRKPIPSDDIYGLTRKKTSITEVESKVIEALAEIPQSAEGSKPAPINIKLYERTYITFSFVDIFWVEKGKKHLIPDWSTYENHRGAISKSKSPINALPWEVFSQIPMGDAIPSVIDEEFRELLSGDAGAEVLPLDEACSKVMGKYVTYLGGIYFMERVPKGVQGSDGSHCRKQPVDAGLFTKKNAHSKVRLQELTSSQALSIPDGKPLADDQY